MPTNKLPLSDTTASAKSGCAGHGVAPATVVTIGAGFARQLDAALAARGINTPQPEFKGDADVHASGARMRNTFSSPAIRNTLIWALEGETEEAAWFYQMNAGWVDMHMPRTLRPTDRNTLRQRRQTVLAADRAITQCDVVIITLDTTDVWVDRQTGSVLNRAPRGKMRAAAPDRFKQETLTKADIVADLREIVNMIQTHGQPGVQIGLIVSSQPTRSSPTAATTLRRAARITARRMDGVHHLPCDNLDADKMAQVVVQLIPDTPDVPPSLDDILVNLGAYRAHPQTGFDALIRDTAHCAHPQVAATLTECAIKLGRLDVAIASLPLASDPFGFLKAQIHLLQDAPFGALMALVACPEEGREKALYFGLRIRANIGLGRYGAATQDAQDWAEAVPDTPTPFNLLSICLAEQGDPRAALWSARASEMPINTSPPARPPHLRLVSAS